MLFQVSGTNVFIIAAIHRQPDGAVVSERYFKAIAEADDCYFEHKTTAEAFHGAGKCSGWTWLLSYIPFRLYVQIISLYQRLGVRRLRDFPWRRKPWWVAIQLHSTIGDWAGIVGKNSVDAQLWAFAEKIGKRPLTLDAPDFLQMFELVPMSEQVSQLQCIVSDPNRCAEDSKRTYENWKKGDLTAMAASLENWLKDQPTVATKVILDRNRLWLPTILHAIENKRRAVFTVGAMHLVGSAGLQALLKEESYGYDLIQV